MRVSIVVPSYQHERFIETTLQSLFAQREYGVDLEIIVVDGGSTDGTVEILRRYEDQIDHWVSEPDEGQTDALIKGFALSTGKVMGWVNSDDVLLPGAVASVVHHLQSHPETDLLYGDAVWMDVDGCVIKTQYEVEFDLHMLLWGYNYIPQPSTFWRRSAWVKTAGLDRDYNCAFDFALWLSLIKTGSRVQHLPRLLSGFRFYTEQKNQRLREQSDAEDRRLVEAFLERSISSPERFLRRLLHRARRVFYRAAVGSLLRRKEHVGDSCFDVPLEPVEHVKSTGSNISIKAPSRASEPLPGAA